MAIARSLDEMPALTVERVIESTVIDPRSYYHGAALKALLAYAPGDPNSLNIAVKYITKLLSLETPVPATNVSIIRGA